MYKNTEVNSFFRRIFRFLEYLVICWLGRICGISFTVRYLRNPNPLITAKILGHFGAIIGRATTFKRTIFIDNSYEDKDSKGDFSNLVIGNNCYIGDCVFFDLTEKIIIRDNCVISGKASFITHSDCNRSPFLDGKFPRKSNPIVINSGSWIGFGAIILSGVTIAENTVVAADSLQNKNSEKNSVYAGIPSKMIKNLDE